MKNNKEDSPKKQGEDMSKEKTNQDNNKQKPDPKDPNQIDENREVDYEERKSDYEEIPINKDDDVEESIRNKKHKRVIEIPENENIESNILKQIKT